MLFELLMGFTAAEVGNGGQVCRGGGCGFLASTTSSPKAFLKGRGNCDFCCFCVELSNGIPSGGPKV